MKKLLSTQQAILFLFCPSPITIDKSAVWGPGNLQQGLNGAYLKLDDNGAVSHLVQPNEDNTAPIGWVRSTDDHILPCFDKAPIWIDNQKPLSADDKLSLITKDGTINYEITELSYICFNDLNGQPDTTDSWIQTEKELKKNYIL